MSTICVEIAVRDDPRLLAALASLAAQTRRPDRVLIAAAPDTPETLARAATNGFPELKVELLRFPGGPVDARVQSLPLLREDITAFLDSDEVAPPDWLARVIAPIESDHAAFAGGPTRPMRPAVSPIERYYELLDRSIYETLVPQSVAYLPLGNSAWSTRVLTEFKFDARVTAEDHDLETRVLRAGLTGVYVPEAWVYHDHTTETSYVQWARKRYKWLVQMAISLLKNDEVGTRLRERRVRVRHPLSYVEAAMKPVAFVHAWAWWSRAKDHPEMPEPWHREHRPPSVGAGSGGV